MTIERIETYLQQVFIIASSLPLHFRCVSVKLANGIPTKRGSGPISVIYVVSLRTEKVCKGYTDRVSSSAVRVGELRCVKASSKRIKWMNRFFQTPISNSWRRSTTRAGRSSKPIGDNLLERTLYVSARGRVSRGKEVALFKGVGMNIPRSERGTEASI